MAEVDPFSNFNSSVLYYQMAYSYYYWWQAAAAMQAQNSAGALFEESMTSGPESANSSSVSASGSETGLLSSQAAIAAAVAPKPRVKQPLNAFMLYLKDQRAKAASIRVRFDIQQASRSWRELDQAERAKYYELARQEKEAHHERHPDFSLSRSKLESRQERLARSLNVRCRRRYGLENRQLWCDGCRQRKKCAVLAANRDLAASTDN